MGLILSAYDYAIQYKEGIQNANADALSRLPLPDTPDSTPVPEETILLMELLETTPIREEQVKNWTKKTPILARVLKFIKQGWPSKCPDGDFQPYFHRRDELSFQDDCILWGNRVVVPPQGRRQVVDESHETQPVRQIIVDPGKFGHAWNEIPGIPFSRNRIDDVTSGSPIPHAPLGTLCLPDISSHTRAVMSMPTAQS